MIDDAVLKHAAHLLRSLRRHGLTVATAESCTGGLVAAALTHHPGSSDSVLGGFVTYSNAMKHALLGVDAALFDQVGAVSAEVAAAMAMGARDRSGADLTLAITGIAGPGGATADKPVGLVWLGVAARDRPTRTVRKVFNGDRTAVRSAAVTEALSLLEWAVNDQITATSDMS